MASFGTVCRQFVGKHAPLFLHHRGGHLSYIPLPSRQRVGIDVRRNRYPGMAQERCDTATMLSPFCNATDAGKCLNVLAVKPDTPNDSPRRAIFLWIAAVDRYQPTSLVNTKLSYCQNSTARSRLSHWRSW